MQLLMIVYLRQIVIIILLSYQFEFTCISNWIKRNCYVI